MKAIALTGNIGSGKSLVANIFKHFGIHVYHADNEARNLMESDPDLMNQISKSFGNQIYKDGKLQRPELASIIFNDKQALRKINELVHPFVYSDFEKWQTQFTQELYVLMEAAIIFENNSQNYFSETILVCAPEEVRIKRVMQRDGLTEKQVRERIANQWPDEKKRKLATFIIENDGNHSLIEQIDQIHKRLARV